MNEKIHCWKCGVEKKKVITEIDTGWGEHKMKLSGIPAYKCNICGGESFDKDISEAIEIFCKTVAEKVKEGC